jgi:hypothetical protein
MTAEQEAVMEKIIQFHKDRTVYKWSAYVDDVGQQYSSIQNLIFRELLSPDYTLIKNGPYQHTTVLTELGKSFITFEKKRKSG